MWLLAEVETDRKSDVERKSSTDPDSSRRQQPVSIDPSAGSSSSASTIVTTATTAAANAAATTDVRAAALVGIFDEFDWDLDSAESLQSLSEEDLKKRHSVMIEKVSLCW